MHVLSRIIPSVLVVSCIVACGDDDIVDSDSPEADASPGTPGLDAAAGHDAARADAGHDASAPPIVDAGTDAADADGAAPTFTVGGTVTGLVGSLVLQNGDETVAVTADGPFVFPTPRAADAAYAVTVATQPAQAHCEVVEPSSGQIAGANVEVVVQCSATPSTNPINADCDGSFEGSFSWIEVAGASYELEYGLQGEAATSVAVATSSYTPPAPLGIGAYDWRVRSIVNGTTSSWSAPTTLYVGTTPDTPKVTGTSALCSGQALSLDTDLVAGATYAWSGPSGFASALRSPTIEAAEVGAAGSYQVVVTQNGCASAPASFDVVVGEALADSFQQTLDADFAANSNANVTVANDRVTLVAGDAVDFGNGSEGAFAPNASTTLTGGLHQFASVSIPAGVVVTVIGTEPLVLKSTGTVSISGILDASGPDGESGVTYNHGGVGALGRAGGGAGGDGTYAEGQGPLVGSPGVGPGAGFRGEKWSGGGGGGFGLAGGSASEANGLGGPQYGSETLLPLVAGSGGGGGSGGYGCGSGGGGAGGGAILVAAPSIAIAAGGAVQANGGHGGSDGTGNCGGGGGGSGGAIRMYTASLANEGTVSAVGGAGGASQIAGQPYYGVGAVGGVGRVRLDGLVTGEGTVTPAPFVVPSSGSSTSPTIAPKILCGWGALTFTTDAPPATEATVDVLDGAGAVLATQVASGTVLATLPTVASASSIQLRVNLSHTDQVQPALLDWSLAFTRRNPPL